MINGRAISDEVASENELAKGFFSENCGGLGEGNEVRLTNIIGQSGTN